MTDPIRVLYVDDEPDLLEISRLFLEESGDFSVTTSDSGPAALNLLKEQQFDAIVSDYQMPGMDGIQFLVEVRSRLGQVPFILFTGKGREEVVIQAINSGADFYIQKGGEPGAQFAELGHKIKQASSRKRALDSLRKSEEKYRHLIEHANEAIVVAQDGLLKMVNPRGVELIGYPEQEILSMAFSDVIYPDDRAMVGERYQKRLKGEELPSRYAFRLSPKDGRTLWVEISAVVIDWEGRPATLNFLTDITERKQAEEALFVSESFNRNLIENLPDYIGVSGPDGKVLYMNQSAVNALGYTIGEVIGTPVLSYVAKEYRDEVVSKMADRHGGGEVPPYEIEVLSRDGHRNSVIVRGTTIQYRDTPAYLLVLTDITGRKEAEAAVRASRDRLSISETDLLTHRAELETQAEELRAAHLALGESRDKYLDLYEFAPLGYLMLTDKALVAEANLTGATLLGVERSRLINQRFSKFVAPADSDQWHQYFMHILDQVEKLSCNLTLTRGDGATFPARLEGIRITSDGGVTVVRLAVSDISDMRRADEALRIKEFAIGSSLNAIAIADLAGNLTYVNAAFLSTWGYQDEQEVLGRSVLSFWMVPDEARQVVDAIQVQGTWSGEMAGERKDGTPIQVQLSANLVRDTSGAPVATMASFIDITGRKRVEEALVASEEKYRLMFTTMINGFALLEMIYDEPGKPIDCRYIDVNPAHETLTGLKKEDIIGRTARESIPGLEDYWIENYGRVDLTGTPWYLENYVRGLDRWYGVFAYRTAPGFVAVTFENITGRKQAELDLESARERLKEAHRLAHIGTWDWVVKTDTVTWSEELYNIAGWDPAQPAPSYAELPRTYTPASWDLLSAAVTRALSTGEPYNLELELVRPDGSIRWANAFGGAKHDTNGEVTGLHGTLQDITERKLAEEALRQTRDYLESLFTYANAPIIVWNPDFEITRFNQAFEELAGRTGQEVLGKRLEILFPTDSCNASMDLIQKALSGEQWQSAEIPIFNAISGEIRIVLWNSANILAPDGKNVLATIAQGQDITKRKEAEDALRESEQNLRDAHKIARLGQWDLDLVTNTLHWSDGIYELFEIGPSEFGATYEAFLDLIHPDDRERVNQSYSGSLKSRCPYEISHRLLMKDGRVKWVNEICHTDYDPEGLPLQSVGIVQDISGIKQAEEALSLANRKLNLLSGITRHDINNQLLALNGFLKLLHSRAPDPALEDYFTRITKASDRISAMIQFTREYEQIGVNAPAWQDARTLVDITATQAPPGKVIVNNDLPSGTEVYADPLIIKVFYNLVDNAVRHGGKVTTVRFSAKDRDSDYTIVCEDDGAGVPAEEKGQIFERGFGKNTGLGLALSREVLDITGITITENGEPGRGARFEIVVPEGMWRLAGNGT